MNVFIGLRILFVDNANQIIKMDSLSIEEDTYRILEMFFLLTPYFSRVFFEDSNRALFRDPLVIKKNIDFYIDRIKTKYEFHPFNIALLAILYGLYAQYDESYVVQYEEYLDKFLDNYMTGIWNHMTDFNSRKTKNNLNMNAILMMIILQGMTEARIQGGVAETRFYYEELRIRLNNNMNMPNHWSNIRVSNLGFERINHFIRNNTLFIASTQ